MRAGKLAHDLLHQVGLHAAKEHLRFLLLGKRVAFVMGSERYGISRVWYDKDVDLVAIPMLGQCDSLNVGVAGTVLLYEACVKNKLGGRK